MGKAWKRWAALMALGALAVFVSGSGWNGGYGLSNIVSWGTVDSWPGGVRLYVGDAYQDSINKYPAGTVFAFQKGTHRIGDVAITGLTGKSGNTYDGQSGAIISGAVLIPDSAWGYSDPFWYFTGQTWVSSVQGSTWCDSPYHGCYLRQDLFFDDERLTRVTSRDSVSDETEWFFTNDTADTGWCLKNPWGHKVELGNATRFIRGGTNQDGVTFRNLIVEKFAANTQSGAIDGVIGANTAERWVVDNCEVRWNHAHGIRTGPGWTVTNNHVHGNGQCGIGGHGEDSLRIAYNEIAYNNTAHYDDEHGGGKITFSDSLRYYGNNSHHNFGSGVWLDIDNEFYIVEANTLEYNWDNGIHIETSWEGIVRNNVIRNNGQGWTSLAAAWLFYSGVVVQNSRDVEIYGNVVTNNGNSITGIHQDRGTSSTAPHVGERYETWNMNVHDNTCTTLVAPSTASAVAQTFGGTGIAEDDPATADSVYDFWGNVFNTNTYVYPQGKNRWHWKGSASRDSAYWAAVETTAVFDPQ